MYTLINPFIAPTHLKFIARAAGRQPHIVLYLTCRVSTQRVKVFPGDTPNLTLTLVLEIQISETVWSDQVQYVLMYRL